MLNNFLIQLIHFLKTRTSNQILMLVLIIINLMLVYFIWESLFEYHHLASHNLYLIRKLLQKIKSGG